MIETDITTQLLRDLPRFLDIRTEQAIVRTTITVSRSVCPVEIAVRGRQHAIHSLEALHHDLFTQASHFGTVTKSKTRVAIDPSGLFPALRVSMECEIIVPGNANLQELPEKSSCNARDP